MKLSEGLRTIFLVGVGAVAITGEKSKALIDDLVKKGELTVEEGKLLNEDMARKLTEKAESLDEQVEKLRPDNVAKVFREAMTSLDSMTKEARAALRSKLDELDKADAGKDEACGDEKDEACACGEEKDEACACGEDKNDEACACDEDKNDEACDTAAE